MIIYMASDTSSDLNNISPTIKLKKNTTDTDLYLGLVGNPNKTLADEISPSSSFNYNNDSEIRSLFSTLL